MELRLLVMTTSSVEQLVADVVREHPEWSLSRQLAEVMRRSKGSVNPRFAMELLGRPHYCTSSLDWSFKT